MHCYCMSEFFKAPTNFTKITFDEPNGDNHKHCEEWLKQYAYQNLLVYGASALIATINAVVCMIFDKITFLEAQLT